MDTSSWSKVLGPLGTALPVFLAALIGAGAGYFGVRESIDGQLDQQQRQFEEAREQRTDDRRSEVYATFLDAANRYAFATEAITSRLLGGCAADEPRDACYSRLATELTDEGLFGDLQTARYDY